MLHGMTHTSPSPQAVSQNPLLRKLGLKPGEIIKGTVLETFSQGEVLIRAKGRHFRAFTNLNLSKKDEHHFQVRSLGSKIELKVRDGFVNKSTLPFQLWTSGRVTRDQLADILVKLSQTPILKGLPKLSKEALYRLSQLTPSMIFNNKITDPQAWISRFLTGSGLFWENKVVRHLLGDKGASWKTMLADDLKGSLLFLLKTLQSEKTGKEAFNEIIADIERALSLIEEDQVLNLSSTREGLGWVWFIPGSLGDGFHKTELFVREMEAGDEIHFSMFMEFTHLGQMDLDVSILRSVLCMKIFVEDQEKVQFITDNLPLLEQTLQGAGFETGVITCHVKKEAGIKNGSFSEMEGLSVHIVI